MKKLKKERVFIAIIIICIIIAIIFLAIRKNDDKNKDNKISENNTVDYVTEVEDGIKLNTSSKMSEDKTLGQLKITRAQLTTKNGMTTFLADVINEGTTKTELKVVGINLIDEKGKTLISLTGVVESLEPGGKTQLNVSMTSNYIEAYDYNIFEK